MQNIKNCHTLSNSEKELLQKCKDAIQAIDQDLEIILYGSRARGDSSEESDYDFLIVGNKQATLAYEDVLRKGIYPIELDSGAVLTVIYIEKKLYDSSLYKAMPFYENVSRDGVFI